MPLIRSSKLFACFIVIITRGRVDDNVWRFLLTGGVALENPFPNPASEWLIEKSWSEVVRADDLPNLNGFRERKSIIYFLVHLVLHCY